MPGRLALYREVTEPILGWYEFPCWCGRCAGACWGPPGGRRPSGP